MVAYVVIQVEVTDPTMYVKYMAAANGTHDPFGGKFLVRGGAITPLEGDGTPSRFVLIEFPNVESALGWYRSPGYQSARKLRLGAAKFRGFVVEGVAPTVPVPTKHGGVKTVNLAEKFGLFQELWSPRQVATVDNYDVKIAKAHGEFSNHVHADEDEFFLVLDGELRLILPQGEARLGPGELFVVPKGTPHHPMASKPTQVLLFERKGVVNTGNVRNEQTRDLRPA